jgi:hypothetical protein
MNEGLIVILAKLRAVTKQKIGPDNGGDQNPPCPPLVKGGWGDLKVIFSGISEETAETVG